ncbi:MAG: bifunctional 4-hydroxy-2-oxoglutarate aldolase/2-dehydro-3-deoxy-phosphogluconate aldolase [Pseudomonadales bacterium]
MQIPVKDVLRQAPVIPVLVIEDPAHAVPLARALYHGGLPVLEITLRTPVALEAIGAIKAAVPEAIVGAGTVITTDDISNCSAVGAQFMVSPGSTPALLDAAIAQAIPLLPGAASASEAMQLLERGISCMKFFPAEAAGGIALLKSLAGPLPQITFCPTGGINLQKASEYLALPNVECVGGSWMAAPALVNNEDWTEIESLARQAAALKENR